MTHWGNSFPGNELPTDNTEGGEWIEHDGKGLPVDVDADVTLLFRDGDTRTGRAGFWHDDGSAECSNWIWFGGEPEIDIIAYRVVKP